MIKTEELQGQLALFEVIEEGGWSIKCQTDGTFDLYEIPQYGGEERFFDTYTNLLEAIKKGRSWT